MSEFTSFNHSNYMENIIIKDNNMLVTFSGDISPYPYESPYKDALGAYR